jgi:hypothetical protein
MNRYSLMPSYKYYNAEGSPVTLNKSYGQYLRDYQIYGSCGELTADGKYKIPITVGGKNLVSEVVSGIMGSGDNFGKIGSTSSKIYRTLHIKNLHPGTYMLSCEVKIRITNAVTTNHHDTTGVNISVLDPEGNYAKYYGLDKYKFIITQFEEDVYIAFRDDISSDTAWNDNYWVQAELGETATEYETYKEPVVTNIYLDEPLADGEYIDYLNQKLVKANGEINIELPAIKTLKGTNIIEAGGASNIKAQYYK